MLAAWHVCSWLHFDLIILICCSSQLSSKAHVRHLQWRYWSQLSQPRRYVTLSGAALVRVEWRPASQTVLIWLYKANITIESALMQDLCRHAQFVHWLCAIWLRPWRLLLQKRYEQESLGRPLIRMTRCSVHLAQELKPTFEYLRTEVCWSQVVPSAAAVVKQVLFEHWKAGSRWSSECVQIKMETQKKNI